MTPGWGGAAQLEECVAIYSDEEDHGDGDGRYEAISGVYLWAYPI